MDTTLLLKKDQEAETTTHMKKKYDVVRNKRGFMIDSINKYTVCFVSKVLVSKLLHKMHPEQCIVGVITLDELCAEGVHIN